MSDRVIRQELECRKGVSILQQTEPSGWLNRIMDYGKDRYGTRDEAVLEKEMNNCSSLQTIHEMDSR